MRKINLAETTAHEGELPLDYMLRVMRDPTVPPERRDNMAGKAAPYIHPTLRSTEHSGRDGGPIQITWLEPSE